MSQKRKGNNEKVQPKKPNNEDLCNKVKDAKNEFSRSWMGDKIQLLLMTALDFKSQCEYEGTNWESKRSKYEQML